MNSRDIPKSPRMLFSGKVAPRSQVSCVNPTGIARIVAPIIICRMSLSLNFGTTGLTISRRMLSLFLFFILLLCMERL